MNDLENATTLKALRELEEVKKERDELIHTLIYISAAANINQNIVEGNIADSKLAELAKTQKNAADYIEKVTGRNIEDVLAENEALAAIEEGKK
ncbi:MULTISPECIES: hypothetical protein [Lactococcus]|uniref:hypothetical protein n=1 Tax=Lactococcus TaxID=1357 RepID=UPI001CC1CEF8|nr:MULTISPECIES: hypothetical protein [Lactococcus]